MKTIIIIIISFIPTLISLLAVIIFYKKLQPKWLRLFFYLLVFTLAVDVGAVLYSYYFKKSNHFIINIYLPVSFSFYFLIFSKTFETKKFKTIIYTAFIVYLLFFLYDIIFIEGLYYFNTYSYCLGSILIVMCCLLYFMRLFTSDRLMNYFTIPMFWISTGLLFFFVGSLVLMSLMRYIIENHIDPDGRIYEFIMVTLNVLLYGAFTISFLCNQVWKKTR
jgi:hypothetical protein